MENVIILSPIDIIITNHIKSLQGTTEEFELTDEGPLEKYLVVNIQKQKDRTLEMKRSYLIERITRSVASNLSEWNPKVTQAALLHKDLTGLKQTYK